jgi:hypothetical protein
MSQVHARARTTPLIRAEIRASTVGVVELAEHYNISRATAAKWKNREDLQDRSHRLHKLSTTLSEGQKALVAKVRRFTLIPLDDLLAVLREFINHAISRAGLDRCLRRHGVGSLRDMQAQAREAAGEAPKPAKTFKDYAPDFAHADIKYLPQMPDEAARRYLFVAIDRATRWVFLRVYADQSEASALDFLGRLRLKPEDLSLGMLLAHPGRHDLVTLCAHRVVILFNTVRAQRPSLLSRQSLPEKNLDLH